MKYFAKYLPVEGEIKVGDTYTYNSHLKNVMTRTDETDDASYTQCIKVKLFLCSRDIQPNDYAIEGLVHIYHDGSLPPFKKIGGISPNTAWVREGDEFDKDEVRFMLGDFTPWKPECIDSIPEDVFLSNVGKLKNTNFSQWIEIKGPCGHFH